jgi:hypothetical protein
MRELSPHEMDMMVREFATALRRVREEETERLRDVVRILEMFRDGLADLIAEQRGKNAAWAAQKPLTKGRDHFCEKFVLSKSLKNFARAR